MSPETSPKAALCSTCHRPLLQSGPDGECVRCLFASALLPDEAGWESDVHDASPSATDGARYGQFEILTAEDGSFQELGAGAMGVTYRAQDRVLHRPVALKVISRSYAGDRATRARFLREARAAAQLRHPNVASVHHYGEQDGQCFYAMELVEGETLEARVRSDGPLPVTFALEITLQVARALVAAEAQGIVHRDLKPSNIMLVATAGEHGENTPVLVKVIDFGLAKAVAANASPNGLSDTRGGFVGTPAFASPEQHARDGGERIDTRSDIYSLGVTLWYLLTGKLPFVGQTLSQIHEQQVGQPLPLAQLRAASVPVPLMALLRSMLAVAPAARPQSARELLDVLVRAQKQLQQGSPAARLTRWAGLLTAFVLLVVGAAFWLEHRRSPVLTPDHSLAVLPFENLSPDPANAFFTVGVQNEIAADLARIADLRVASPDSTKNFPPGQRDLAAIGRQLGVTHLLEGSCRREHNRFDVRLRLIDLRDPGHPWTQRYERPLGDVSTVETEITRTVSARLGAALSSAENIAIGQPPTRDPVAYDLYLRARDKQEVFTSEDSAHRSSERNIVLLDQAVARDPHFARAWCQLAEEHDFFIRRPTEPEPGHPPVDHRALAEAALQKAHELAPESGEVHLSTARHLESVGQYTQANVEADLACRLLPNSALAEFTAGSVALRTSHWNEAIPRLEKAVTLNPVNMVNLYMLGDAYSYVRRDEEADSVYAKLLEHLPADDKNDLILQCTLRKLGSRGDLIPLRAALNEITEARDPQGELRFKYGLVLELFSGNPDGANRVLALGKDNDFEDSGFHYPRGWFEGLVARMRHDPAAARRAFEAARPMIEKQVAARPGNGFRLSFLALVDAGLDRKEDAVREALHACELAPYESQAMYAPAVRCNLAAVYAWTGRNDQALAVLAQAVERPAGDAVVLQPTYGDLKMNPVWDELRDDPRFATCVQKLAPGQKP